MNNCCSGAHRQEDPHQPGHQMTIGSSQKLTPLQMCFLDSP